MHRILAVISALVLVLGLCCCGGDAADAGSGDATPTVAFITNGPYSFWNPAEAGVLQASRDFGVRALFRKPEHSISEQKQIIEDVLNRGVDGLAVSPIDPDNQTPFLDKIASRMPLVTHDSDAPGSKRRCFVGIDNYAAGRMIGEIVQGVMPEGGKVALFIGNLSQDNARLRRQGVLDVLLGRTEPTPIERVDPSGAVLTGGGFTVVGTYTDDGDRQKCKANAEDVLNRHPDLAGMVGLFAFNPPACIEALRQARKLGEVNLVGFDEDDATLLGIEEGYVAGTVVQNPYQYGYRSVEMLVALIRGEEDKLPQDGIIAVPARKIDRSNLAAFRAELKQQLAILEDK